MRLFSFFYFLYQILVAKFDRESLDYDAVNVLNLWPARSSDGRRHASDPTSRAGDR